MAAHAWPTNGHLIADVARLGYLTADMVTLDTTHGRGVFWRQWRPDQLVTMAHPDDPGHAPADLEGDFRALPFPAGTFDAVIFDPPYMPKGTPNAFSAMDQRYGVGNRGQDATWALMAGGLTECARVVKPGGRIITKAGRGIDGGRLWRGDNRIVEHGEQLGLVVVTQLVMITRPRPQAHRGPQRNPRSNFSTLTVWDAPEAAPVPPPEPSLLDLLEHA